MTKSRTAHKPKKRSHSRAPEERQPLDLQAIFRSHKEAILVALAVLHVLLFLVFFLNMAAMTSPRGTGTFDTNAPVPEPVATAPAVSGKTVAVLYGLFSIVLWIAVAGLWRSGSRRRRERRFTMMMLTPGTVMVVYLLWRAFASGT